MPGTLLTADLHLTDKDEDLYRWDVFEAMKQWVQNNAPCRVVIAGDITDKKDRHSALLVNTLAAQLIELAQCGCNIAILRGNHDTPLNGPPFWQVLELAEGVTFIDEPYIGETGILYLPYSDCPIVDWAAIQDWEFNCIIMHQTVTGVMGNNGFALINDKMPELPPDIPIYSGDIHNPQNVEMENGAVVQYIGGPHPVNYGDTYPCRMLVLDENTFGIAAVIALQPPAKHMIEVYSLEELQRREVRAGDSAKVRFFTTVNDIPDWPLTLESIKQWAAKAGVSLASVEPVLEGLTPVAPSSTPGELLSLPGEVLGAFIREENIGVELADAGLHYLQEAQRARASS